VSERGQQDGKRERRAPRRVSDTEPRVRHRAVWRKGPLCACMTWERRSCCASVRIGERRALPMFDVGTSRPLFMVAGLACVLLRKAKATIVVDTRVLFSHRRRVMSSSFPNMIVSITTNGERIYVCILKWLEEWLWGLSLVPSKCANEGHSLWTNVCSPSGC